MKNFELLSLILGIFAIVSIIAFWQIAINVSKILKHLNKTTSPESPYANSFNAGEIKELQGKKQEALDCYIEAGYLISKMIKKLPENNSLLEHKKMIDDKIVSLSGKI